MPGFLSGNSDLGSVNFLPQLKIWVKIRFFLSCGIVAEAVGLSLVWNNPEVFRRGSGALWCHDWRGFRTLARVSNRQIIGVNPVNF